MTEPVAAPVVLVPVPVALAAPVELAPESPVPDELEAQVTAIAWEVLRACAWPATRRKCIVGYPTERTGRAAQR